MKLIRGAILQCELPLGQADSVFPDVDTGKLMNSVLFLLIAYCVRAFRFWLWFGADRRRE